MILKSQAELRRLLVKELQACVKCGNCMAFCPMFQKNRGEAFGMRGKIALLQALEAGRDLPFSRVQPVLDCCLGCRTCKSSCPNGVNTDLIILLGKAVFYRPNLGSVIRRSRIISLKYDLYNYLLPLFVDWKNALLDFSRLKKAQQELIAIFSRRSCKGSSKGSPIILPVPIGSRVDKTTKVGVTWGLPHQPNKRESNGNPIVIFPGCQYERTPSKTSSVTSLFDLLEIPVVIAGNIGCCGFPALISPDPDVFSLQANSLVKALLEFKAKRIIALCVRCRYVFKIYENFFHLSPEEKAAISSITDLSSFMGEVEWEPRNRFSEPTTFHDPCVQLRGLGDKDSPRSVLRRILTSPLLESGREGSCCGFCPHHGIVDFHFLKVIRDGRLESFRKIGAKKVVTNCLNCYDFFKSSTRYKDLNIIQLHDLIIEAINPKKEKDMRRHEGT